MKKNLLPAARVLLALPFLIFGLNHFLHFLEQPTPPPAAGEFLGALTTAEYLWPVVKVTEILAGLMLLTGQWVPLALVLLAPIVVNIVGYHAVLDPGTGLWIAVALAVLWLVLVLAHMKQYRPMLARAVKEHGGG